MKTNKIFNILTLLITLSIFPDIINAQLNFTVNTLADDEFSYAWDNPATPEDESMDGICEDELHRCSLGAAYGESFNMDIPVNINFSVSGTVNLMNAVYLLDGSSIDGGGQIELSNQYICMSLNDSTTVKGLKFSNASFGAGLVVDGNYNKIGVLGTNGGNEFVNCQIGMIISGDSNEVYSNYIGIDKNKVLMSNIFGILVTGNYNEIGRLGYFANFVCGNFTGILIGGSEFGGMYNRIRGNVIGTTFEGEPGLGNQQGILIEGGESNFIENNTISGNSIHGVAISGAPPKTNSPSNVINNNTIGLDFFQTLALPNGNGIVISNGTWLTDIRDNTIAGNNQIGIFIKGIDNIIESKYFLITGNKVGLNDNLGSFPNNSGIVVEGNVSEVWIGSVIGIDDDPNFIVSNTNGGIIVKTGLGGYAPKQVTFRKNIINENVVTNLFVDTSANLGIQPPYGLSFNGTTLAGIHQIPNAVIDIYDANILEGPPSAYRWLGSTTTDANGIFTFEITDPLVESVSVTASTSAMGTSSFAYLQLVTDVEDDSEVPTEFLLEQNYPNPFNPSTTIEFSIPEQSFVLLEIYNSLGEKVSSLVSKEMSAGNYNYDCNAVDLSSGIYLYRLQSGSFIQTKKMMLLR